MKYVCKPRTNVTKQVFTKELRYLENVERKPSVKQSNDLLLSRKQPSRSVIHALSLIVLKLHAETDWYSN
ncbi:hypothetical protein T12_15317 [Trichinella patagoniensis]|uniref:Uncharacterized protein n=1 Tax=Trichinella patagoniensis TaxID=990121 RepID=A0A0V0ZGH6_9BILA|nr:hypothetical protein T12_15317 [Trichinella patagoniensis]